MKRPDNPGWYWVQIPGYGREIVVLHVTDSRGIVFAYRIGSDIPYVVRSPKYSDTKGWRWLGRAVMEAK